VYPANLLSVEGGAMCLDNFHGSYEILTERNLQRVSGERRFEDVNRQTEYGLRASA
jgi:hypothetical protein